MRNNVCWICFWNDVRKGGGGMRPRTTTNGFHPYSCENPFSQPHVARCPDDGLRVECADLWSHLIGFGPMFLSSGWNDMANISKRNGCASRRAREHKGR